MARRPLGRARTGGRPRGRAPRLPGWLAAAALLLHGWSPILLQVALLASTAGLYGHAQHASADGAAPPGAARSGKGPECPLLDSAICLCATVAKLLPAPAAPAPARPSATRAARPRCAVLRPPRRRRSVLFDARAPPRSD